MEQEVVKAIAAFMNTYGGKLLIGVEDNGRVAGLENDYKAWGENASTDIYLQHVNNQVLRNYFSAELSSRLCKVELLQIEGKHICQIVVEPSKEPVKVEYSGELCFFIRNGATSVLLQNTEERENYIREHFKIKERGVEN